MTAALQAENLYRFFHAADEETLALQGVSLAIELGEMMALTGPSGSGKSTLLSCLAGLDEPDGGRVLVAGRQLTRRSEAERAAARADHVGVLYQQANLVGHLSVAENVRLAQGVGGGEGAAPDVGALLERCQISHRAGARPMQLSGGELARASLAAALANDPEVLLCDEPTGELDSVTAAGVVDLLRTTADRGTAVLVVTHSEKVAGHADRRLRMRDGKVAE